MPNPKIKDKFLKLPTPYKIIGIGALIALVGVFLPWYKDIDAFNTGDRFTGVSGPLYLIGYIIIALSIVSLIITGFHLFEKKLPDLPLKESMIYILSGAFSLFLLIVTNSVYFHPKFGINITSKDYQFGMIFAFAGAIAIIIGGVLENRERGTARFIEEFQSEAREEEEDIDEIIELNNFQKEQQREQNIIEHTKSPAGVREYKSKSDWAPSSPVRHEPRSEPARADVRHGTRPEPARADVRHGTRPEPARADVRPEPAREPSRIPLQPTKVWREPFPDPSLIRKEREPVAKTDQKKEDINPNSVIRMDL